MKNYYFRLLSAVTLTCSSVAFGQQTTGTQTPGIYQSMSISKGESQVIHDRAYYEQRIAEKKSFLNDIDVKIDYVKRTPDEDEIAKNNGWYQQMEKSKLKTQKTIEELTQQMNALK